MYCFFATVQAVGYGKLTSTSYLVENIEPEVEYEFRVSAENEIGTSEPTTSDPVKYGTCITSGDRRVGLCCNVN